MEKNKIKNLHEWGELSTLSHAKDLKYGSLVSNLPANWANASLLIYEQSMVLNQQGVCIILLMFSHKYDCIFKP